MVAQEATTGEVTGVCVCLSARHQPNHEWTPGHPHTKNSVCSTVQPFAIKDGEVPIGVCTACITAHPQKARSTHAHVLRLIVQNESQS